ncbi:MAG TPA: aminotransferase class I/II-fold pyridoxal phosphate-dependent enzyme [Alphaproteobacteria bacterium]|nr:aminotransferase class I/II-fold pyridoxal phosphate-dependent enzyme [Alphaproteobacteria bacterium]
MTNPRLDGLDDYPFARLARLLEPHAPPAGLAPLNLSLGEPQHPAPALLEATLRANAHLWGKYPPVAGTPEFRRAAAGWLGRRYGLPAGFVDPEAAILPVAGTREALFMVASLVVPQSKDGRTPAVLLPNPFYAVYSGAGMMAGAEAVYLPATATTGFLPDLDALTPELLARTALVYICSPANPQGAVAERGYWERLLRLAREYDFVLVADECYAEIYDEADPLGPPPGALEAALALGGPQPLKNLLAFHSLSKRSSVPGLRSGFVAGDPALIAPFARLRSYAGAGSPLPALAAAAALWDDDGHVRENRALYTAKLSLARAALGNRAGFHRPRAGFFLWLDVGDSEAAALRLWRGAGIRTLPGAYVGRPDAGGANPGAAYLRIALVHDLDTTRQALDRLADAL